MEITEPIKVTVLAVYIRPKEKWTQVKSAVDKLKSKLQLCEKLIILGDFNVDSSNYEKLSL